ncbi:hypothetical protein B0H21DRAFT_826686 [Amylocystis lapponica]|nr:hypothetical protein B0H21DRAFT_826686 [Amylocystis lapponica]
MSTTVSVAPSSTSSDGPSPSTTVPSSGPTLTSSASLYLYTFLATLILLLSISAAIVVRSYILRRRQRRMIEEAIRNGTYVPPPRSPRTFGEKPRLHDVYLALDAEDVLTGKGLAVSDSGSLSSWGSLMPVAAVALKPPDALAETTPAGIPPARASWLRAWRRRGHRATPAVPLTPVVSPKPDEAGPAELCGKEIKVAFLIAMPAPHRKQHEVEEQPLPHVEFGLAQVVVHQDDDLHDETH